MGRIGTFWNLLRAGRAAELRATLGRSAFPAAVFRRNELMIVRARRLRPLPRPLPGITVRWGTRDDEALLQRLRPRRSGYQRQFDAGLLLLIGESGGDPVSCNWVELGGAHASAANGYRFRYPADGCWILGAEVAPRYRFSGAFHKHFVEAVRLLGDRGVTRVYGAVQLDNPASVNSHVRLGFEPLWQLRVCRVLGVTWHDARPGEGQARAPEHGFGRWDGADPA